MPDAGVGDRSGWKGRIEQSTWVDGARWVEEVEPPVEFLEAEPSAYRLSEARSEAKATRASSPIARILGIGAVAVVLIALAIMSRPGDQDPVAQLPAADQQQLLERQAEAEALLDEQTAQAGEAEAETDAEAEDEAAQAETPSDAEGDVAGPQATAADGDALQAPRPIPELRADLPEDFPGVLFSYGAQESIVTIRRSFPLPVENLLDIESTGSLSGMIRTSESEVSVFAGDRLFSLPPEGGVASSALPDGVLHPAAPGFLVVLQEDRTRSAYVLGASDGPVDEADAIIVGNDLEILGGWGERVLVHQASKVWLLDQAGRSELVTDGVVIGYNDGFLAMVRCDGPGSCRIEVGPPDSPSRRSVPVPENLAGRDIVLWAGSGSVSVDGDRLAVVDRRGPVQLPTWIDLVSGEGFTVSQSVALDSPVAWSPDGRWLAYAFGQDILVWDTEIDRNWRIFLARPISHLVWLSEAEADADSAAEADSDSDAEPDA